MRKHINSALKILTKVFVDKAYSNMALVGENVSDMTTYLVYGVLEKNVKIEYILNGLLNKKPQNQIYILLKIGTFALLNLKNVPDFAIVSECVEVAKMNGKSGVSGFVNAVLKKVSRHEYKLPAESDADYLSVTYSKPQWFVNKIIKQYGKDLAVEMLSSTNDEREHVRVNTRLTSIDAVADLLDKSECKYDRTSVGGISVKAEKIVKQLFSKGEITYQSPSSMLAVQVLSPKDNSNILDLCSAPGGKAIYMSELCPHSTITACDLHEHRVQLIKKYQKRMHAENINAICADATKFNVKWQSAFDFVLVDAPCSCFGTYKKHPDVFLSRDEKDIAELARTQKEILQNASKYVANKGALVYSTCTLFSEENSDVIEWFLKNNHNFVLDKIENINCVADAKVLGYNGYIQILPHNEYDGFFIARLKRID